MRIFFPIPPYINFPNITAIDAPKITTGRRVNGARVIAIKIPVIIADKSCMELVSFKNIFENSFSVITADKIEVAISKSAFIL